jgi:hypothetical protein
MLPRSSRNCFAAASISMQQFHQPRFIRKTFSQRLIQRCQTWWRKAEGWSVYTVHMAIFYGPQNTQNDAETETEILFLFCVNLGILRANNSAFC